MVYYLRFARSSFGIDLVATGSYNSAMEVSVKQAKDTLTDLLYRVEGGEAITITRHGEPIANLVKYTDPKRSLNWEAVRDYKKKHGIGEIVEFIPEDFDDPVPLESLFGSKW